MWLYLFQRLSSKEMLRSKLSHETFAGPINSGLVRCKNFKQTSKSNAVGSQHLNLGKKFSCNSKLTSVTSDPGFLPGIFLRRVKSIVMQIYLVMLRFLLLSDQIFLGKKVSKGGGGEPLEGAGSLWQNARTMNLLLVTRQILHVAAKESDNNGERSDNFKES